MNIGDTIQPASDQLDSVDLITGPRTFVIESVSRGSAEQPVQLHLADFPRPWRPGKSMRRILVGCWGPDASIYVGRRVRLYCDPTVVFGGLAVGGTRIEALSHIDKPKKIPLLVTRGKSAMFTVQPLADAPPPPQAPDLAPMFALLTDAGLGDKEAALAFIGDKIGRTVTTTKELSRDETATVVRALEAILDPPPPADASDPDAPMLGDGA
jgi:hypothetical protein